MLWSAVIFSAILYAATANPWIAILFPYLSAAWPIARSGVWLRKCDHWAERGVACFWFYLAAAGCKAALMAVASLYLGFALQAIFQRPADFEKLGWTTSMIAAGFCIAALLGLLGAAVAVRRGVRVFVVPKLHDLCGGDIRRLGNVCLEYRGTNFAIWVLASAVFIPISLFGLAMCFGGMGKAGEMNAISWAGLITMLVGPPLGIPLYAILSQRVIAARCVDCWPEAVAVADVVQDG